MGVERTARPGDTMSNPTPKSPLSLTRLTIRTGVQSGAGVKSMGCTYKAGCMSGTYCCT